MSYSGERTDSNIHPEHQPIPEIEESGTNMENTLTATPNVDSEVSANASDVCDSEDPNCPRRVEGETIQTTPEQPHLSTNGSSTHREQIDSEFEVHDGGSDKDETLTPEGLLAIGVEKGSGSETMDSVVQHQSGDTVDEHQKSDTLNEISTEAISQQPANTSEEVIESLVTDNNATADHSEEKQATVFLDQVEIECENETFGKPLPQTKTYGEDEILSANESLPEDSRSLQNENLEFKTDVSKPTAEKDSDLAFVNSEQQEANPDSPVELPDQRTNVLSELTSNIHVEPFSEEITITDGGKQKVLFESEVAASTG
ncbi:hypothetical protein AHF37_03524 [Paragonimus kellicotti]|nr:hypothetical protein AHF37_03521 [Paragonimus kellicotti]KAF6776630.1 hypothetical protein AHF37_03524 [Paragonimus kellicotti]